MTTFWSSWWAFAFMLAPFLVGFSGMAINAYTTHHDLEKMKAVFRNSQFLTTTMRFLAGFSFFSRMIETGVIAGAVLWPKQFLKHGLLDPNELRNFPAHLKRRLAISIYLTWTGGAWLFLAVGLLKLTEG
ncbi:hypothetical protein [Pseudomonas akapageensis]|uniref:hypothetical protein n=1 Tax=Pseudomonas akapageensis TaxID=2609961 RepID=UPI00140A6665|nr:hypothetical protein [Pseudomonas akapageensis]